MDWGGYDCPDATVRYHDDPGGHIYPDTIYRHQNVHSIVRLNIPIDYASNGLHNASRHLTGDSSDNEDCYTNPDNHGYAADVREQNEHTDGIAKEKELVATYGHVPYAD